MLGRVSNRYSVQFIRGSVGGDGEFLGVIVVSLDPYYLVRFYEALNINRGFILLVGLDGVTRAGSPVSSLVGHSLTGSQLLEVVAKADHGDYQVAAAAVTGRAALVSYRRLVAYPLVVSVGLDTEEVFAARHLHRVEYAAAGVGLSLLVLFVGGLLPRNRRLIAGYQNALTATLENISQRIIMVDRELPERLSVTTVA